MTETYPRSTIPEPYQTVIRRELRNIPTWKLREAYGRAKTGEPTGIELVERNRAHAISAIEDVLWERGKLPRKVSHSSPSINKEEWDKMFFNLVPLAFGAASLALGIMALTRGLGRRLYSQDGEYLVAVRYPGQRRDIREFVQPSNPDVTAVYSQNGPDPWNLYDFVCQNISYRSDVGEFWFFPSETLRGYGDCEDTSILLTSLLRNCGVAHVALGSYRGLGHAWCHYNGQLLETTYTRARPVPDPQDYCLYAYFNDEQVIEIWPGALEEIFALRRSEATKIRLMAEALA